MDSKVKYKFLLYLQTQLEGSQEEWLEKEIDYEKKITVTEDRLSKIKVIIYCRNISMC